MKTRTFYLFLFFTLSCHFLFAQALLDKSQWDIYFNDEFDYVPGADIETQLGAKWYFDYGDHNQNNFACSQYASWNATNHHCPKDTSHLEYDSLCDENTINISYPMENNFYIDPSGILHMKIKDFGNSTPYHNSKMNPGVSYQYVSPMIRAKIFDHIDCSGNPGIRHGMFEIRCKVPQGDGFYSAFWLTGTNAWPPEIDAFEHNGTNPHDFFSSNHWKSPNDLLSSVNSTSTMTIGSGIHSFILQGNWSLPCLGNKLYIESDLNSSHYMVGTVIGFDPATNLCTVVVGDNLSGCSVLYDGSTDFKESSHCYHNGTGNQYSQWRIRCPRGRCLNSAYFDHAKNDASFGDLGDEFHTYTVVWTPFKISYFFDGKEIRTITDPNQLHGDGQVCTYRIMDVIASFRLNCPQGVLNFQNDYEIDYIRVYKPKTSNSNWEYLQHNDLALDGVPTLLNSSASNNVDFSKRFTRSSTSGQIYYKGTDNRMWNYWWNGSTMVQNCVNWSITDVASDITIMPSNNRIYYRTSSNEIKYFQYSSGSWNSYSSGTYWNCAGSIIADNNKLYYKGTDGNLWNLYQKNGRWIAAKITTTGNVSGGIVKNPISSQVFYLGNDNNIWEVSYSGSWQQPTQLTTLGNVDNSQTVVTDAPAFYFNHLANKFYYKGSDNRIWNHWYDVNTSTWNTVPLSWSSEETHVSDIVAFDLDKNIVLFRSSFGQLWYYHMDNDPLSTNWQCSRSGFTMSPMEGVGHVFPHPNYNSYYVSSSSNKLYSMSWIPSDLNDIACSSQSDDSFILFRENDNNQDPVRDPRKDDLNDITVSKSANPRYHPVTMYPSPVINEATIVFFSDKASVANISVFNSLGQLVFSKEVNCIEGENNITHNYQDLPIGIYGFRIKIGNSIQSGKFIKGK
jgi:beta-glucanase (GH16 family)